MSPVSDASILDELQKLSELHAEGIIPDELFDGKKSILVEKLAMSLQNKVVVNPKLFNIEVQIVEE